MTPMITDILRPKTVKEAVRAKSLPGAAYLGGGTWLNSGRAASVAAEATLLISLEELGLATIQAKDSGCTLGAMITFQQLVDAAEAPPGLRAAAGLTASRSLRNMKTLGGELGLCPEDSALIPALMVLDAEVNLAGSRRPLGMEDFLRDRPGGLILSVTVPDGALPCLVRALSRTSHGGKSLVVAACLKGVESTVAEVRVVVSDCRGKRVRLREAALRDAPLSPKERLEDVVAKAFAPEPDLHASADYKRYMAGVMVADAIHALAEGKARS